MALEKTDNGGVILDFLVSAIKGEFPDFKPNTSSKPQDCSRSSQASKPKASTASNMQPATRRERRDARRADRRISTEIAQIAQEKTDNGRTIIEFLHSRLCRESLPDFKPHHRMSASKELLHCVFDFVEEDEDAEPVETPEERKSVCAVRKTSASLRKTTSTACTGPVYYKVYPSAWPCPCEDRRHDCKGNELTEEEIAKAVTQAPARQRFIRSTDTLEAFKERYKDIPGPYQPWQRPIQQNPLERRRRPLTPLLISPFPLDGGRLGCL